MSLTATVQRRRPEPKGRALWNYSLALYGIERVARACLDLQDRSGLDVNLLLLCCWLAAGGLKLGAAEVALAERAIGRWRRRVVEPLRSLLRALKSDPMGMPVGTVTGLRRRIAGAELAAERVAQTRLAALFPAGARVSASECRRLAAANLRAYLAHAGIRPGAAQRQALALLAQASAREIRPRRLSAAAASARSRPSA